MNISIKERLKAFYKILEIINSNLDIETVLNVIMDNAVRFTGARSGYIALYDEEAGKLNILIARGSEGETLPEAQWKTSSNIMKIVFESGQPIVATNAMGDPRFDSFESITASSIRCFICTPLIVKDKPLGVIFMSNRVMKGIFSQEDLEFMTLFTHKAALAIENARLRKEQKELLSRLDRIDSISVESSPRRKTRKRSSKTSAERGFDVFISYKSADIDPAGKVYEYLASRDFNVFLSEFSLPKIREADFRKAIDDALELSNHMIVVTTNGKNVREPWVEFEWGIFLNEKLYGRKKGNLITMISGNCRVEDLPISLRSFEVIKINPKGLEKVISYLWR